MIKPKKSLGQNFLKNNSILELIVNAGQIEKSDTVLEIGPGTGNLTEKIIKKKPKKIILIEKDKNLVKLLQDKFNNNIEILNLDILDFLESNFINKEMIIFGNLPYNISTQILVKLIKIKNLKSICKKLILMFQKEVAERILSKTNEKNYGRLSVLTSLKLDVSKIKDISPNSFWPSPKIKSTALFMEPKKNSFNIDPNNLEIITNIFFNQRRKMIKKPLNKLFKNSYTISKKLNLDIKLRPQNISPVEYFALCKEYENLI